jgi:ArsR family transcriptional regulator
VSLTLKQIEKISKALGDMSRLKILHYLSDQGGCGDCSSLQDVIDLAQPSISHHVKILLEAELINGEKEGRNYRYTLNFGVMNEYIDSLRMLEGKEKMLEG